MQQKNPIQWFPGHMAKTKRIMRECLPQVDLVLELIDARIPYSSENPDVDSLLGEKPRIIVLTKAELADPKISRLWVEDLQRRGVPAVLIDSMAGTGLKELSEKIRTVMAEKLGRYAERGMDGRKLRAMAVGIPNVGKSSLINKLAGGKRAKVEDRPGVTQTKQWIPTSIGLDLLDMPGVLAPKFEDERVGENLAITGAIKDDILNLEEIAVIACGRLRECAKEAFFARYKIADGEAEGLDDYDLFRLIGKKRGFLIGGGEINEERTAKILLDEFRGAKIGRISLERPGER